MTPKTCRFISADAYIVAGNYLTGSNMFAYCLNNPVMYSDPSGYKGIASFKNYIFNILFSKGGKDDNFFNIISAFNQASDRIGIEYNDARNNGYTIEKLNSGLYKVIMRVDIQVYPGGRYDRYIIEMYYGNHTSWIKERINYDEKRTVVSTYINVASLFFSLIMPELALPIGFISSFVDDDYNDMINDAIYNSNTITGNYAVIYSITSVNNANYVYTYGSGWTR